MSELELTISDSVTQIVMLGDYDAKDRIEQAELATMCERALKSFSTMNGDTGIVELSVRQFALLIRAVMTGESCQAGATSDCGLADTEDVKLLQARLRFAWTCDASKGRNLAAIRKDVLAKDRALQKLNRRLDAMHWVWCDGGCDKGVHRFTEGTLTEADVEEVERNTKRLRAWWDNHQYKLRRQPATTPAAPEETR